MELIVEEKAGLDLWRVQGSLLIQDVQAAKVLFTETKSRSPRRMLDLTDMSSCDTAGVQFLFSFFMDATRMGIKLDIPVWPESVLTCARNLGISFQTQHEV